MNISFKGKRALVTGAGQGIGRGVAIALAKCGAEVVGLSKSQGNLDSLKNELPGVATVCVNLSDWDATRQAVKELGPIDLLVNCAAIIELEPCLDTSLESIERTYATNTKAIINVSQIIGGGMVERKTGGAIVNVSSIASSVAFQHHLAYSSSKAALDQITKVMAVELGPHNIRVNVVNPTAVLTEMGRKNWDPKEEKGKWLLSRTPLGRLAEVEDVVNPILFLLSEKAAMITGHCLPVEGGLLAC